MKTSIEDISPVKKKLQIEVEPEEVDKKFESAYQGLRKKAKIPGFRPGKAPISILKSYFGRQVTDDVTSSLINETFPKAIEETHLQPLGVPLLEKEIPKEGQSFKYTALMEVTPQVELKDYLGLEIEKEKYSITEEDVTTRLEEIRNAHGKLVSLEEERPARNGDYVVLNCETFEDGRPIEEMKAENLLVQLGRNRFQPQVEEALIGLSKDQETEVAVNFEQDPSHPKLAGKTVNFKVRVVDIQVMQLPELDDQFAQDLQAGFDTLEDLKKKVRETLTEEEERRIDRETKQRLLEKVSQGLKIELPESLVQSEVKYAIENLSRNLERGGSSLQKEGLSIEKLKEDFRPISEKKVKEMIILGEIAKRHEIRVADEDLNQGFEDLAKKTGQAPQTLRKYYEAKNLTDSLRETLLQEKTLNYLMQHAKIKLVTSQELRKNEESNTETK